MQNSPNLKVQPTESTPVKKTINFEQHAPNPVGYYQTKQLDSIKKSKFQLPINSSAFYNDGQVLDHSQTENLLTLFLPIVYGLIVFVTALCLLITVNASRVQLSGSENVLNHLFNNLKANPILSIKDIVGGACATGEEVGNIGDWSGIKSGCLCRNEVFDNYEVYPYYACIYKLNCKFVKAEEAMATNTWNNQQYCVKTSEDWDRKAICDTGDVKCASDICVKAGQSCPENNIVQATSLTNGQIFTADPTHKWQAQFVDAQKLTLRPLIDLRVSTGTTICLDSTLSPYSTLFSQSYPLFNQQSTDCGKFGPVNPKYIVQLGQIKQTDYYTQNEITPKFSRLPYWDKFELLQKDDLVYLLGVKKFEVLEGNNADICKGLAQQQFDVTVNYLNSANKWGNVIGWVSFATGFVILFLALAYISFLNSNEPTKISQWAYAYIVTSFVLAFAIIGLTIFYFLKCHKNMSYQAAKLISYADAECFEDVGINNAFRQVQDYNTNTLSMFYYSLIVLCVTSVIYFLTWIMLYSSIGGSASGHPSPHKEMWDQETERNN